MSEKPKGKRDFSDIDNLERATESFMRGQRKALTGSHAGSRAFHTLNLHKLSRFGAVFAVIAVIIGTVVFAGIRFGKQDQEFLKPAETASTAETTQTDPPAETTLPEETVTEEAAEAQPIATVTSSRAQTSAAATTSASATETTGTGSSATTGTGTATSTTARTSAATSPVVQISPAAATQAPSTAAPVTAPPVTAAQNVTAPTTAHTTAHITARTTVTTRATTTVRTTTTVTTTVRTTTTVTTTTEPKVAVIRITGCTADGHESYSGNCQQKLHIKVTNSGNAPLTGTKMLSITCGDEVNIIHVGCTSGNTSGSMSYSASKIDIRYSGSLAPGERDTIELTVISRNPIWSCTY